MPESNETPVVVVCLVCGSVVPAVRGDRVRYADHVDPLVGRSCENSGEPVNAEGKR